ncbi:hypothetical protein PR202_gb08750 [Eleusine coracana subsp. coracana]|uniref:Uncharacterized protein n=1 Tax=Eleusine coracana subsp. coracana TaxID=191504 RepID=A0AAV5EFS3_ELECO|nr:hypothetical protein QOZ80_2BG0189190 [Eleusine coracana subsp. coracana]GJN21285.1 hypothetical protein PR202_gb08750 [Eleusine coracana subsp. coracana]
MPASPSRPSSPAPSSAVSTPRRRRRLFPSSSKPNSQWSPSSLAPASPFSFFPPTSPSPFHRFLPSPLRASSVPFSWEHRPGIPKTPARTRSSSNSKGTGMMKALPLPPSLLSRSSCGGDQYGAVVPAEYAAMHHHHHPLGKKVGRKSRRPRLGDALAEWISVLSLYRSCKRAAACFASKANKASSPSVV